MKVDVFSPEDNVGDVIGDLNRRRGMIKSQEVGVTGVRVKADAPLAEMFGYIGHSAHADVRPRPVLDGVLALRALPGQRCRGSYRGSERAQGEQVVPHGL